MLYVTTCSSAKVLSLLSYQQFAAEFANCLHWKVRSNREQRLSWHLSRSFAGVRHKLAQGGSQFKVPACTYETSGSLLMATM